MPDEDDIVVMMVWVVPKEMEIDLFESKPHPSTVIRALINPDIGATEIFGPVNVPIRQGL